MKGSKTGPVKERGADQQENISYSPVETEDDNNDPMLVATEAMLLKGLQPLLALAVKGMKK